MAARALDGITGGIVDAAYKLLNRPRAVRVSASPRAQYRRRSLSRTRRRGERGGMLAARAMHEITSERSGRVLQLGPTIPV